MGKHLGEGDAESKVHPERLSPAIHLVAARTQLVNDANFQGLNGLAVSRAPLARILGLIANLRAPSPKPARRGRQDERSRSSGEVHPGTHESACAAGFFTAGTKEHGNDTQFDLDQWLWRRTVGVLNREVSYVGNGESKGPALGLGFCRGDRLLSLARCSYGPPVPSAPRPFPALSAPWARS